MQKIIYYGIDAESVSLIADFFKRTWSFCSLQGVILEEESLWGLDINGMPVMRPSELLKMDFDIIILLDCKEGCNALRKKLREEMSIPDELMIDCMDFRHMNIANHEINWDNIESINDIRERIKKCNNLSELERWYYNNDDHRLIEKYAHYLEVYNRHFSKYIGTDCVLVEVGVFKGGSLQMWKHYLGEKATIIGIDIEDQVREFEEDQIRIEIGSQSSRGFWKYFRDKYPKIDIFIDDGGHTMEQQIITFEEMFNHVAENGIYLCEDCHTSYWDRYDGGYNKQDTFIEYSKRFVDDIHAWYSESQELKVNENTRSMHSLHYYDSMVVIEKRKMNPPVTIMTGKDK